MSAPHKLLPLGNQLNTRVLLAGMAVCLSLLCADTRAGAPSHQRAGLDASTTRTGPAYASRPDALEAAEHIAREHGLDSQWVRRAIGGAHLLPEVARFMSPSQVSVSRNWQQYKNRMVDPVRVNAGLKFWKKKSSHLRAGAKPIRCATRHHRGHFGRGDFVRPTDGQLPGA